MRTENVCWLLNMESLETLVNIMSAVNIILVDAELDSR